MNLIISIKPQFVEKILSGEKKYEFRRRIYKKEVEKIYIYQTAPDSKIVACFKPGKIIKDPPQNLCNRFKECSETVQIIKILSLKKNRFTKLKKNKNKRL